MSIPTDDLLRALLDQLTPGPWIETRPQDDQLYDIHHKYDMLAEAIERREDAEFIAAAPSLVASLLARASQAEQERDAARAAVQLLGAERDQANNEVGRLRDLLDAEREQSRGLRTALERIAELLDDIARAALGSTTEPQQAAGPEETQT